MKIVYLTSRLPFPPIDGRRVCLFNYCKYFAQKYGHEVVVISFLDDPSLLSQQPDFISRLHLLDHPPFPIRIWNVLKDSLLLRRASLQSSLFWTSDIEKRITSILDTEQPDVIISDMTRTGRYFLRQTRPKILNLDDLISRRYRRLLELKEASPDNLLGDYLQKIPSSLRWLLTPALQRLLISLEIGLLAAEERTLAQSYDGIVLVSEEETKILRQNVSGVPIVAIPMGVEVSQFTSASPEGNTVVFLGLLSIAHNEHAVLHFYSNIFPLVKAKVPDARFLVVGNKPTDKIKAVAATDPDVEVTGWVEDVAQHVQRGRAFVAPLLFGSGVKTKIIEAMAMGVPVITTPVGAEGIGVTSGKEVIIAGDPQAFADAVINVLTNRDLAERLTQEAAEFIRMNFLWSSLADRWQDLLSQVTQGALTACIPEEAAKRHENTVR